MANGDRSRYDTGFVESEVLLAVQDVDEEYATALLRDSTVTELTSLRTACLRLVELIELERVRRRR